MLDFVLACITYALSGLSVILMRKRGLVALLLLSFGYLGTVKSCSSSSWCLRLVCSFAIMVFPDHTHLLFAVLLQLNIKQNGNTFKFLKKECSGAIVQ